MNEMTTYPEMQKPMAVTLTAEMSVADIRKRKELVHELMRELMVPGQHYGAIPGTDGKPTLLKSGAEMLCMTFRLAPTFSCGENFDANDRRITSQPKGKVENADVADQWNTVLKMAAKRAHTHAVLLATAASDMFVPEDDDEQEGDQEHEPRPEPKPTPKVDAAKQELCKECATMATAIGDREAVRFLMTENGIPEFEKWGDLEEAHLRKARDVMRMSLERGKEPTK